eukprot:CAMPEP_0175095574 /NCGR_PEP_ID=MMETSP0086_2-20121207/4236_1 /TAXON_ID=136419 /ORGANISM="Unknown Unknown, Strain D1" /LENGTH=69 /DNA_ID=CAMNT_0016368847 /DNA_START=217 /DNA_END=426 /DNA_ORIENTATION=-
MPRFAKLEGEDVPTAQVQQVLAVREDLLHLVPERPKVAVESGQVPMDTRHLAQQNCAERGVGLDERELR